jgi:hypothetical protein
LNSDVGAYDGYKAKETIEKKKKGKHRDVLWAEGFFRVGQEHRLCAQRGHESDLWTRQNGLTGLILFSLQRAMATSPSLQQ